MVPVFRLGALWRCTGACAVAALIGVSFATSAEARLAYERGFRTSHPTVWAARDNGTGAKRLAYGLSPLISPNGRLVAYMTTPASAPEQLMLIPASGGARPRVLLSASLLFAVRWSPDSKRVGVAYQTRTSNLVGNTERIVTIDVATGKIHAIARGSLPYSLSFSPSGGQLAYTWSTSTNPIRDDVYRVGATGGTAVRLTFGGHSMMPVWGRDWIVFVSQSGGTPGIPKQNLYLVRANGTGLHRLTHAAIGRLMFGFMPIAWSANGRRLLAEFTGPASSYVVTVDPTTGAVRPVGKPTARRDLVVRGAGLSRDGSTILGVQEDKRERENVVALPYRGGRARVLARNAVAPSWSR